MIKEVNEKINNLNKSVHSPVKLPVLTSNRMKLSAITNLISGSAVSCLGVVFDKKSLLLLGGLGLMSSALMYSEYEKEKK